MNLTITKKVTRPLTEHLGAPRGYLCTPKGHKSSLCEYPLFPWESLGALWKHLPKAESARVIPCGFTRVTNFGYIKGSSDWNSLAFLSTTNIYSFFVCEIWFFLSEDHFHKFTPFHHCRRPILKIGMNKHEKVSILPHISYNDKQDMICQNQAYQKFLLVSSFVFKMIL